MKPTSPHLLSDIRRILSQKTAQGFPVPYMYIEIFMYKYALGAVSATATGNARAPQEVSELRHLVLFAPRL